MTQNVSAYVGIGSNMGDPVAHVSRALADLDALEECRVLARSRLYRSAPMGPVPQDWYVNAVAKLRVSIEPDELLRQLLAVEAAHGRHRGVTRWGPRTLDLDILLYGDRTVNRPGLTIPHPGLTARNFVVYPLLDIAPDLVLPCGRRLADVASGLGGEGLEIIEEKQVGNGEQGT